MNIVGYITYRLLNINGEGHQPYQQVASLGMGFEGGMYGKNGRMLGYLSGDENLVDDVVDSLSPWCAKKLTQEEALDWVDSVVPVNTEVNLTMHEGKKYIGKASIDSDGKIQKPYSDVKL